MENNTKIIATIGPACDNKKTLQSMVDSGVNVFRLNMSHGDKSSKQKLYNLVKSISHENGERPCILADLAGPKIRITDVLPNFILAQGQLVTITNEKDADDNHIRVTKGVGFTNISKGAAILINDGRIQLEVIDAISKNSIYCKTEIGGLIEPRKGVNFPGITLDVPTLTDQDKIDLHMALDEGADWIALSFVRSANDLKEVHRIMDEAGRRLPVMAKIEKWEALDDVEAITDSFDGIMVARGDLGVEIPAEQVPIAQKQIIEVSRSLGKPIVIATQLLESMIESLTPTRAEVSDIANAVFDGVDALMVTGETAMGQYPIDVIQTLKRVITETEQAVPAQQKSLPEMVTKTADAISHAVCEIVVDLNIKAVMTMTHSGSTALMIARYRPTTNLLALTPFRHILRRLQLVWGIVPIKVDKYDNVDSVPDVCKSVLEKIQLIKQGERFVITGGVPMGVAGTTNYLSIQKL
ncbi:MAG: pyruvate kinase [Candidatus Marinimicrobia bacterium]|nr:pyruvate kinase [Candidatus Neomarinimicrobiota bacterium]MBL7031212.1 pyruvate kinase [Candidatus Neomarinimicrobiota bacterium]